MWCWSLPAWTPGVWWTQLDFSWIGGDSLSIYQHLLSRILSFFPCLRNSQRSLGLHLWSARIWRPWCAVPYSWWSSWGWKQPEKPKGKASQNGQWRFQSAGNQRSSCCLKCKRRSPWMRSQAKWLCGSCRTPERLSGQSFRAYLSLRLFLSLEWLEMMIKSPLKSKREAEIGLGTQSPKSFITF